MQRAGRDGRDGEAETRSASVLVERLARAIHEDYVRRRKADPTSAGDDPAMRDWGELDESLKDSNRDQALDIERKLEAIGCKAVPRAEAAGSLSEFTDDDIEKLARLEHLRWAEQRRREGWRAGPEREPAARRTPYLVPWGELPETVRDLDRDAVRAIPRLLAQSGLAVVRRKSTREL